MMADWQVAKWQRARARGMPRHLLRYAVLGSVIGTLIRWVIPLLFGDPSTRLSEVVRPLLPYGVFGLLLGLGTWHVMQLGYEQRLAAGLTRELSPPAPLERSQHAAPTPRRRWRLAFLVALIVGVCAWQASVFYLYRLDDAVEDGIRGSHPESVEAKARWLLALSSLHPLDWSYGNAIMHGHVALGVVALERGDVGTAREHLLAAGRTPGSPQLDTFGPNMRLAEALLQAGERDVVLEYFDECRAFWRMDDGDLDQWSEMVRAGQMPDFGANRVF